MAFGFGIVMIFLILAAQYERWSLPFAVITAVPFALFGALLATWAVGLTNNVYFQIGLVTLVGLAAKNAILIVEFAVMKHEEGMTLIESALEAARLRFRPIVMTSLAFILGCVPLVTSSGAGAASRHALGWPVIGGMLAATFIAIFFIPLFFRLIMKSWRNGPSSNPVTDWQSNTPAHAGVFFYPHRPREAPCLDLLLKVRFTVQPSDLEGYPDCHSPSLLQDCPLLPWPGCCWR